MVRMLTEFSLESRFGAATGRSLEDEQARELTHSKERTWRKQPSD
jgi:hypothetical protein